MWRSNHCTCAAAVWNSNIWENFTVKMPWTPLEGFDERTEAHHMATFVPALADVSCAMIVTHATRGEISGRTTGILKRLHKNHELKEITLLLPEDAPHGQNGYALEKSAAKATRIAELLQPHKEAILSALKEDRMLVAGNFAWSVLRRLGKDVRRALVVRRVVHPCHWMNVPMESLHMKLGTLLKTKAPSLEQICTYIVKAHKEALRARWKRMTPEERHDYRKMKSDAYNALPQEEKDRRAQMVSDAYNALPQEEKDRRAQMVSDAGLMFWKGASAYEKIARTQACLAWRTSATGKVAWKAALKKAKANMEAETKRRVMEACHQGYAEKMTCVKQKMVGKKRQAAWTEEMREEARKRLKASPLASNGAAAMEKARTAKAEKQPEVNKRKLLTCALKLVDRIREIMQRVSNGDALTTPERRTLREQSRKYLDLFDSDEVVLEEEQLAVFREAEQFSRKAGANSKSEKMKSRHAEERASRTEAA